MKFVTVASARTPELNYLLDSCIHFKADLKVIGLSRPYLGNGTKIVYLLQYLKTLGPKEVICFTDAYDSFLVRPPSAMEEAFHQKGHPAIFTAEDNFYFRLTSLKNAWLNRWTLWNYPKGKGRYPGYRFLNSGGFIGYAGHLRDLLSSLQIDKSMYSDQQRLHRHFTKYPDDISLDYDHDFFTIYGKYATDETFKISEDKLTNSNTNSNPYIFHFPGKTHRGLDNFASQFSYMKSIHER